MDLLTFISTLVGHLAWPIAAVAVLWMFRQSLVQLIPLLRKAKYKDFEVEFGERLQAIEAEAEIILPKPEPRALPQAGGELESLAKLAELSPRGAIVEAFTHVEAAVNALAEAAGIDPSTRTFTGRVLALGGKGIVTPEYGPLFDRLRALRSVAAHSSAYEPTSEQAHEFIALALRLARALDSLRSDLK
jgi:hypothetical protein